VSVEFTGLRPGEKLHEELHSQDERARMTRRERILAWDLSPEDEPALRAQVAELERVATTGDSAAIRRALSSLVPDYRPAGEPDGGAAGGPGRETDPAPGRGGAGEGPAS